MFISSDNRALFYSGRVDFDNPKAPVLVYTCSYVKTIFTGRSIKAVMSNKRNCYRNFMGVIVDGVQSKIELAENEGDFTYTLAENLSAGEHELILFKRMDGGSHYVTVKGFEIEDGETVKHPYSEPSPRRIEVIGDSVSCGEKCEILERVGMGDPEFDDGCYSNGWYSYSWQVARNLGAELHNTSQGGISLFDKTGWFNGPDDYRGVLSCYDKLEYNPPLGMKNWNFDLWKPHVVILAIGQNDANPVDIMEKDYDGEAAQNWRNEYRNFILKLRELYPGVTVICTTTLLMHHSNWDRAIDEVVTSLDKTGGMDSAVVSNEPSKKVGVYHFMYKRNGAATPGHPRTPEHDEMAAELTEFIRSLGEEIWN